MVASVVTGAAISSASWLQRHLKLASTEQTEKERGRNRSKRYNKMAMFDACFGQHSHNVVDNCVNVCFAFCLTRLCRMENRVPDNIRYWFTAPDSRCVYSLTPVIFVSQDVHLRRKVASTSLSC